jgi:Holliday junction resolvase
MAGGSRLRKLPRKNAELGSLELFTHLDPGGDIPLTDPTRIDAALKTIRDGLVASVANKSRVLGWHAQAMFEGVLVALGDAVLVKVEDAGDCYFRDDLEVGVPDFRVVTSGGAHLLIEVKNHDRDDPRVPFSIRGIDLERLTNYASLTSARPLLATYWTSMNLWTLTDLSVLERKGAKAVLSFSDAAMSNEMAVLGDRMIGTTPPLEMRLPISASSEIDHAGLAQVTLGGMTLAAGGRQVTDPRELRLGYWLLLNANWGQIVEPTVKDNRIEAITIRAEPAEWPKAQGFAMVGWLSELFSTSYWMRTADCWRHPCMAMNWPMPAALIGDDDTLAVQRR